MSEKLYTDTPMGKAIMEALGQLNDEIAERFSTAEPGSVRAYVFGGAALHIHTNARGSADIDVEISAVGRLDLEEITVLYTDEHGDERQLVIDDTFNPMIAGLLPEYYQEDAIPLFRTADDPLHAFVVTGIDLAVSKLDRLGEMDQADIISLYRAGKFDADGLRAHAEEALLGAVGNEKRLKGNINFMISQLDELETDNDQT